MGRPDATGSGRGVGGSSLVSRHRARHMLPLSLKIELCFGKAVLLYSQMSARGIRHVNLCMPHVCKVRRATQAPVRLMGWSIRPRLPSCLSPFKNPNSGRECTLAGPSPPCPRPSPVSHRDDSRMTCACCLPPYVHHNRLRAVVDAVFE